MFKCFAIGSGNVRRGELVRIGVALLEGVCHYWGGLSGIIYAQAMSDGGAQSSAACKSRCRILGSNTMFVYAWLCYLS